VIARATNAKAAADSSYATIANVDVIEPGWKLCIPSTDEAQMAMSGASDFNWQQRAGETIVLGLSEHPWTNAFLPHLPEFEALTGIKVEYQIFSEPQLRDKMLISLQAKSPEIDVWPSLKSREGLKYFKAGYYAPLNTFVNDPALTPPDYDWFDFGAGPVKGETFAGQLTGIPINVEGPAVYYRKDLFEAAGVSFPETMDDIVTVAKACMEAAPEGVYGVTLRGLPPSVAFTFGEFMRNYGVNWRDDSGQCTFTTPQGLSAINSYVNLAKEAGPPGFVTYSYPQSSALMASGNACMEIEATNELRTIIDPANSTVVGKVGIRPYPPGPTGLQVPNVLQWGVSINAFSEHKEAAWLFLAWVTSKERMAAAQLEGIASPRFSGWATPEWEAKLGEDPIWGEWSTTLQHIIDKGSGEIGPPAVEQPIVRQVVGDMIDSVYLGLATAEEAAQKACTEIDAMEY
jgi:multiple sugar transport system substrate-binding protein